MAKLDDADQIATNIADMKAALRGLITFTIVHRADQIEAAKRSFAVASQKIEKLTTELDTLASSDEEREQIATIRSGVRQWAVHFGEAGELCAADKPLEADTLGNAKVRPIVGAMQTAGEAFAKLQREGAEASRNAAAAKASRGVLFSLALGCAGLLTVMVAFLVVNQVTTALRRVASIVSTGSSQVEIAAKEIAAASQSLAQNATEQAATIEETSASSHEINSLSRKNAEHSHEAATVVDASRVRHDSANQALGEMVVSMQKIKDSSHKVAGVLKVVDEIAFQTNILALNAAVEAARAGEAGLGFAVVADEVRNLAQKCAQAARETSGLIENAVVLSDEGGRKAETVEQSIQALMKDSGHIKELVEQVRHASDEQAQGTDAVAAAIHTIQDATQHIAAQAEESAASSRQLSIQSEKLFEAVEELAAMTGGTDSGGRDA